MNVPAVPESMRLALDLKEAPAEGAVGACDHTHLWPATPLQDMPPRPPPPRLLPDCCVVVQHVAFFVVLFGCVCHDSGDSGSNSLCLHAPFPVMGPPLVCACVLKTQN